jgi:carbon storage regulator
VRRRGAPPALDRVADPVGDRHWQRYGSTRTIAPMLTLTRKEGQRVLIGNEIKIEVRETRGRQCRIGIIAPPGLPVMREELYVMMAEQNAKAARTPTAEFLESLAARFPAPARPPGAGVGRRPSRGG